jgi:threonine dehydrogenase-like Zn-dependent dehydrogenase
MKAVVYHGVGDIRLDDFAEPTIQEPTDATVRLTASAICGTDLHFVRGTMPGTKEGPILGHEGALEAYEQFDRRQPGWLKVALAGVSARA